MKLFFHFGVKHVLAAAVLAGLGCGAAHAQDPVVVATTAVAVIEAVKTEEASSKMQKLIDRGGYQYGDKVTIFYDPTTNKAIKIKGKASKPV